MNDNNPDKNNTERSEGFEPETAPTGEEALKTEERSLDIGESGQFAPGGYYNQHGVTAPDRSSLDENDRKF